MSWDDGLLPEQRAAAVHTGTHARMLAGPGTGKTRTLTRHICFLIAEKNASPDAVLAITFTRAAARELRQRVERELGNDRSPRISTLHSFALRQLLRNSAISSKLPQPLRIADDWEEQKIVLRDLKSLLELGSVSCAGDLLNQLSSDWQSLTAEEEDWERRFPNPKFLSAWREHRRVYGYTLRTELVYQLKKTLEQRGDFELDSSIGQLLVDEYQDLNRCDLAVVKQIASRGAELFIAGDDDQSIYGFRKADPEGIRRFDKDYPGAAELGLTVCMRCDRDILELGLFVAEQDYRRIPKDIQSEEGRAGGEVFLLRFDDQNAEAAGIADLCAALMRRSGLKAEDILILLRNDSKGGLSNPIKRKLEEAGIAVATTETLDPFEGQGREFWAFLRLAVSSDDSLAWRTVLESWSGGFGQQSICTMYQLALSRGESFAQTVKAAHYDKGILPNRHRTRIFKAIDRVQNQLKIMFPRGTDEQFASSDLLLEFVQVAADCIISDKEVRESVIQSLGQTAKVLDTPSLEEFVTTLVTKSEELEQEFEKDKVNISTMHRAKGLTAKAVIVAGAEDEFIPGRAKEAAAKDDERRLLYVSLTRAEHHLFITYCDKRTGSQKYTGRDSSKESRSLTEFLVDCSHTAKNGRDFVAQYSSGG